MLSPIQVANGKPVGSFARQGADPQRKGRIKHAVRLALLTGCAAMSGSAAHAQRNGGCPPAVEDALRHVNSQAALKGEAISRHCKPWPPSGGKTLAAVMAFEQGSDTSRRWTGVLALVDARSARLLHSHSFKLEQDATTSVGDGSLRLDTAPYNLAPGVRALGLRYAADGPGASAANSYRGDELTLFVPDGRRLRAVLGLSMSLAEAITGCLGSCPDAVWDSATRTLAIGTPGPLGWNDLHVTATVTRDGPATDLSIDRKPQRKLQVYRYNGRHYEVLSSQWDWDDYCCSVGWPPGQ